MKKITLHIVTPVKVVFSGEATALTAPGIEGLFGVLPDHAAMVSALGKGTVRVQNHSEVETFSIEDGFLEVADNQVRVLTTQVQSV